MTKYRTIDCIILLSALVGMALLASPASAQLISVYGSPTYTPGVGGYQSHSQPLLPGGPGVNNSGTAIGSNASKFDGSGNYFGDRAVRWGSGTAAVELGNLGTDTLGFTLSFAFALNTAGTAVGYAQKYDGSGVNVGDRAVRWDASGTAATELGNLGTRDSGFANSHAYTLNTAGTAVGYAQKYDGSGALKGDRAVRWDGSGTAALELGNLGTNNSGATNSYAYAINTANTTVGYAEKYASGFIGTRAVRWDGSGTAATELGILGTDGIGATYSTAYAVNTAGTAVGFAAKHNGLGQYRGDRPVRWDSSTTVATELGNLGMDASGSAGGLAYAINTAGMSVGISGKNNGSGTFKGVRAVRWDASTIAAIELGTLGTDPTGYSRCLAYAVNTAGTTVGYAEKYDGSGTLLGDRAVYWALGGPAVDLNTLIDPAGGWILTEAKAISDTNWISGIGMFDPDGAGGQAAYARLFVMQVPEPSGLALASVALLALGLPLLVWRNLRRPGTRGTHGPMTF